MSVTDAILRETRFALHDRSLQLAMLMAFFLSSAAVSFGWLEVQQQRTTINQLLEADQQDRAAESGHFDSWGSAAYYNFHFTYDAPSNFAFAALGQRDLQPWKHRIRMLALEGQIYERDSGNPVFALIGRFDFAFLAAFLLPLVLILLLHNLRADERAAGRYDLLEATAENPSHLWLLRSGLRVVAVVGCLITPLMVAGAIAKTPVLTLFTACVMVVIYALFWAVISHWVASWRVSGGMMLMSLTGLWLLLAVIMPTAIRSISDRWVPIPSGAEILMLQRETVNDAWDLPRADTMTVFFEHYPQWSQYTAIESAFEWPWYYAFQAVGDIKTEPLTQAYRAGRLQRDRLASWASWLSPPALLERQLQALAHTDLAAAIAYEDRIRAFHGQLRSFYYPRFFRNVAFEISDLKALPEYETQR